HVNAPDALHLAFGGKALVKSFGAKLPCQVGPRAYAIQKYFRYPFLLPALNQLAVSDEIAQDAQQGLESHVPRKHVFLVVSPDRIHNLAHGFKVVKDERVSAIGAHLKVLVEKSSVGLNDLVDFVENLRL